MTSTAKEAQGLTAPKSNDWHSHGKTRTWGSSGRSFQSLKVINCGGDTEQAWEAGSDRRDPTLTVGASLTSQSPHNRPVLFWVPFPWSVFGSAPPFFLSTALLAWGFQLKCVISVNITSSVTSCCLRESCSAQRLWASFWGGGGYPQKGPWCSTHIQPSASFKDTTGLGANL